jgi:hypothetical protein
MKIVMGFEDPSTNGRPPARANTDAFNSMGRVPLLGEHVRFLGADHEVLSVVTDLDDEVIRVGLSGPE